MMPPQQLDSIDAEELAELERLFDAEPAHPGFNDVWTNSDQAAACAEGWAIFEAHGYLEIEKDDNPDSDEVPELQDDDAAIAHVEARAAAGSEMHQRALAVHRKYTESIRKAAFGEGEES